MHPAGKAQMKVDKTSNSTSYALKKVEDYYVKQIYFKKETPLYGHDRGSGQNWPWHLKRTGQPLILFGLCDESSAYILPARQKV